jgi:hypothetical protein
MLRPLHPLRQGGPEIGGMFRRAGEQLCDCVVLHPGLPPLEDAEVYVRFSPQR